MRRIRGRQSPSFRNRERRLITHQNILDCIGLDIQWPSPNQTNRKKKRGCSPLGLSLSCCGWHNWVENIIVGLCVRVPKSILTLLPSFTPREKTMAIGEARQKTEKGGIWHPTLSLSSLRSKVHSILRVPFFSENWEELGRSFFRSSVAARTRTLTLIIAFSLFRSTALSPLYLSWMSPHQLNYQHNYSSKCTSRCTTPITLSSSLASPSTR